MPLVVPGINSGDEDSKTTEWMNKLVGKKIGESSDATVIFIIFPYFCYSKDSCTDS
jgi:phosphoribosylpyrophosphate synthetase